LVEAKQRQRCVRLDESDAAQFEPTEEEQNAIKAEARHAQWLVDNKIDPNCGINSYTGIHH
jgi:hypothetical protein